MAAPLIVIAPLQTASEAPRAAIHSPAGSLLPDSRLAGRAAIFPASAPEVELSAVELSAMAQASAIGLALLLWATPGWVVELIESEVATSRAAVAAIAMHLEAAPGATAVQVLAAAAAAALPVWGLAVADSAAAAEEASVVAAGADEYAEHAHEIEKPGWGASSRDLSDTSVLIVCHASGRPEAGREGGGPPGGFLAGSSQKLQYPAAGSRRAD